MTVPALASGARVAPAQFLALVHHGGRGSQYLPIRYTERLAESGIEQSVGTVGDSYDNALAESIIGLYKTEVIRLRGPWRGLEPAEFATLERVDWFNNRRLLEVIGNRPPQKQKRGTIANASIRHWPRDSTNTLSGIPRAVHPQWSTVASGSVFPCFSRYFFRPRRGMASAIPVGRSFSFRWKISGRQARVVSPV